MNTLEERWETTQASYGGKVRTFARNSFKQIPGFTQEDMEQELLVVLWECVIHYDPNRGASFNTYFQGSARNRIISLIRHYSTQSRKADVISLEIEGVATAVNAICAEESSEDKSLRRMEVQEWIGENGVEALYRSGRGRRKQRLTA